MFQEEVTILEDTKTIKIKVKIEMRQTAYDEKKTYKANPERLIPEKFKNRVKLKSKPNYTISNQDLLQHSNSGEWIYEIIESEQKKKNQATRKPRTRTRRKQNSNAKNQ